MSTWYVRPNIGHGVTRNGALYATAWGGWSEIIWGGAGVKAGDTLYVCGAHSIASAIAIGNHGATPSSRVTISGGYAPDPGSITVTAIGGVFLQVNRSYTTIVDLTITANKSYCLYFFALAPITGVTIEGCTLNGGTTSIISLDNSTGTIHTDLTINDNNFNGGSGSPFGSAISWLGASSGAPLTALDRVTITNNRFTGCTSTRAVIDFLIQEGAHTDAKMSDIIVTDNTLQDCGAVAMEIYGPAAYGRNTGIRITGNVIRNQQAVNTLGGGMAIGGFAPSTTNGFGANIIAGNEGYGLSGKTGMVNVFYGTYQIYNNYGEDITTSTIDGTGILFDHDTRDCVAYGNTFKRLMGVPGIYYSGNGITILDSTNVRAYGNLVEDAYCGVHLGNKLTGQSSSIHNNTFLRCGMGIDVLSTADKATNFVRNNVFTGTGSTASVRVSSTAWTGESHNSFFGFGAPSGHTLAVTTKTADPKVSSVGRPLAGSPLIATGTYLGGKGVDYKTFHNPPCIGAYEYVRPRSARI